MRNAREISKFRQVPGMECRQQMRAQAIAARRDLIQQVGKPRQVPVRGARRNTKLCS